MRSSGLFLLAALVGCKAPPPLATNASFTASPALATRNPGDIAVLPVEDGSPSRAAARHLQFMREELQRGLPARLYSPIASHIVDAALLHNQPGSGETLMTPAYLKRVAGKAAEDAALAVHIDRWDESRLLSEMKVAFQFSAVLVGNDGAVLWNGSLSGDVKAGGLGPAPRDRDAMARSCAEIALGQLLTNLNRRSP